MKVIPKRYKYKRIFKNRTNYFFRKTNFLNFGQYGVLTLQFFILTARRIFRLKIYLKRSVKKPDITQRKFWFNASPHLPITKKPIGSRMGKGKGKTKKWFAPVKPGTILVEFRNLRHGRAIYFFQRLTFKLKSRVVFLNKFNQFVQTPMRLRRNIVLKNY